MTQTTKYGIGTFGIIVVAALAWYLMSDKEPVSSDNYYSPTTTTMTNATLVTSMGTIEIELNGSNAPKAVANFVDLAGKGFYDGVRFHRVIKGFMIQTGDPLSKDPTMMNRWGTGGPGKTFEDELTGNESYSLGTVAMANSGPNTNGSQFFIVTAQPGVPLPPSYTVFGRVTKGIDVALAIEKVPTTGTPYDRPLQDVIVQQVTVK